MGDFLNGTHKIPLFLLQARPGNQSNPFKYRNERSPHDRLYGSYQHMAAPDR